MRHVFWWPDSFEKLQLPTVNLNVRLLRIERRNLLPGQLAYGKLVDPAASAGAAALVGSTSFAASSMAHLVRV